MEENQKILSRVAIRTMQKDIEATQSRATTGLLELEELEQEEKDQRFLEKLEQLWHQKQKEKEVVKIVPPRPVSFPPPHPPPAKIQPEEKEKVAAEPIESFIAPLPSVSEQERRKAQEQEKERAYIEELKKRILEERDKALISQVPKPALAETQLRDKLMREAAAEKVRKIMEEKKAEIQEKEELKRSAREKEKILAQKAKIAQKKLPLEKKRDEIAKELEKAEAKLSEFYEKESALQRQIEDIELQEQATSDPDQQKDIELKRWELESSLQKSAKERWLAEDQRLDIQARLENVERAYQELTQKELDLEIEQEKLSQREKAINLNKQRRSLEKQIKDTDSKLKPLRSAMSKVQLELNPFERRLEELKSKEQDIEQKIKNLEAQIRAAQDVKERKALERELWLTTEKRHAAEKEKWQIQEQKSRLQEDLTHLAKKEADILSKKEQLEERIREISMGLGLEMPEPQVLEIPAVQKLELPRAPKVPAPKETHIPQEKKMDAEKMEKKKIEEFLQKLRQEREKRLAQVRREKKLAQEPEKAGGAEKKLKEKAVPPQPSQPAEAQEPVAPEGTSETSASFPAVKREEVLPPKPRPQIPKPQVLIQREQKLTAQEAERERIKKERIEELKQRLAKIQKQEESKRFEFAAKVAAHKPGGSVIPEVKPLPESQVKTELIIRTQKPSAGSKIIIRTIVALLSLLALGGVVGFWYWMIFVRPKQPPPPPPPPPIPEEEVVTPELPLPVPISQVRVDETQTLEVENSEDLPLALITAFQQEKTTSRFIRLLILNPKTKTFYSLPELFESSATTTPPGFFDRIDGNSYTFFHHLLKPEESVRRHHLGLVTTIKNRSGLLDLLQDWEDTIESDTQLLLRFLGTTKPSIQKRFGQFTHKEVIVRCLPFERNIDFGICWGLKSSPEGDVFIFTSSGLTAREIIDRLP